MKSTSAERGTRKTILITGASSGLGWAITQFLADHNYHVIATDLNTKPLSDRTGPHIEPFEMDISSADSVRSAYGKINSAIEGLDGLVNNAGIFDQVPVVETDLDRFEKLINVNMMGAFRVTNVFFPMLYRKKGQIINISSETAKLLLPFQTYGCSKYMLEAWSNMLRMELRLLDMHVSLIRAGGHLTPLMKKTLEVLENIPADSLFHDALIEIKKTGGGKVRAVTADPFDVARMVEKVLHAKHPKPVYSVNESLLFRLLPLLPKTLREYLVINRLKKRTTRS